jgi:hypothetical protein
MPVTMTAMTERPPHVRWQPLRRGALLGYAPIELVAYGVVIDSIPILTEADDSLRAGGPSHPPLGSDGGVILKAGKLARMPPLGFAGTEIRERFLRAAVAVLHAKFPTGLPTAGGT